jgi:hypothetical protein
MRQLFKDKSRPFYNFGVHYDLGVIEPSEWQNHIFSCFKKNGFNISPDICGEITGLTGGHPYCTQLVCGEMWDKYSQSRKLPALCLTETLRDVLRKENQAFQEIWDSLNGRQRKLLEAIALNGGSAEIFSSKFLQEHKLGAASSIQRSVAKLLEEGWVMRIQDVCRIIDPLFLCWLREVS